MKYIHVILFWAGLEWILFILYLQVVIVFENKIFMSVSDSIYLSRSIFKISYLHISKTKEKEINK